MQKSVYWSLLVDSIPIMIGVTFETIILTINMHYSTDSSMMSGMGLASILVHCLGGSLISGFNTGYTNFASRAFGAKNRIKYNQYLIQGFTNLVGLLILLSAMGFGSYRLAIVTGQEENIAHYSYLTFVYILPGFCCFYISDFVRCYLNSQLVFKPVLYVFGTSVVVHLLLSMMISSHYGFNGVVMCTNITFMVLLSLILLVERKYSTWSLSLDLLKIPRMHGGYKQFLRECFYVATPFSLELFMFEFMAFYLGSFHYIDQTAAHVAVSNISNLMIAPYIGYSICCMTYIGNYIGQNKPLEIDSLIKAACKLSLLSIFILQSTVLLFQNTIAGFFTSEPSVQRFMFMIFKLWTLLYMLDPLQFIMSHAFKALGLGSWVTKNYLFSYYLVAALSMVIFCRVMDAKILAVWTGFFIGVVVLMMIFMHKYMQLDIGGITLELHVKVKDGSEGLDLELLEK